MSTGYTPLYKWAKTNAFIRNEYVRESISEFLGTALLCFFVVGSGFESLFHSGQYVIPVFGTIFGLMVTILIFGGISGAHINPAVSLGLAVAGELSWIKVPFYFLAQFLGGVIGTLLAYGLYMDTLIHTYTIDSDGSKKYPDLAEFDRKNGFLLLNSFCPVPQTFVGQGFATEVVLTAILLLAVMACIDKGNMKIPSFLLPFMVCLTVGALCFSHSVNSGTLLNPARDIGPRLAMMILGWDNKEVFTNIDYNGEKGEWWIVGLVGPMVGAVIGVLIYCFCVGNALTNNRDDIPDSPTMTTSISAPMQSQEPLPIPQKPDNPNWRSNTQFVPVPSSGVPRVRGGYNMGGPPYATGAINQGYNTDGPQQPYTKGPYGQYGQHE